MCLNPIPQLGRRSPEREGKPTSPKSWTTQATRMRKPRERESHTNAQAHVGNSALRTPLVASAKPTLRVRREAQEQNVSDSRQVQMQQQDGKQGLRSKHQMVCLGLCAGK
jgi:hypothetical protein